MSAFKKLKPEDLLDNVIVLEPQYDLASGTAGWRGSPEGGSSLNLYGGYARNGSVSAWKYDPIKQNPNSFGQIERTKLTASINYVWMTDEALASGQVTNVRWGEEHWDVVQRLYEHYRHLDPDYQTASYDYYCLYYNSGSLNVLVDDVRNVAGTALVPSASFTVESWIKPFVTSSAFCDFTIQSWNSSFWFGITGSTGRLMFSSSLGQSATSSVGPTIRRWNHVAFSYDSTTKTGSFFVNKALAGTFASPSASITAGTPATFLSIGNQIADDSVGFDSVVGRARRSFHGFVAESRYWESARSLAQISASSYSRLTGTDVGAPLAYLPLNEGGLTTVATYAVGSGAIDQAGVARGRTSHDKARLVGFSGAPLWHPNDNTAFSPNKALAPASLTGSWGASTSANVQRMLVISIPSAFYGRQISPESVRMECRAFSAATHGLHRVLIDDGRGGLFLSGSACSSSLTEREEYRGVEWNKVGNVFYGEGLIVIREQSLLDFGRTDGVSSHGADTFQLSFKGISRIPVKTIACRLDKGEFNCTTNPTFSRVDSDDRKVRRFNSGSIWITTIGIYDDERKLVGVAKLAQPIRKRPHDRITFKLRMDY